MTLKSLLKDYSNIELAEPSSADDNRDILEYYHLSQMTTSSESIFYDRGDNFFDFLKERSDKFLVFTMRSDDGVMKGIACVSFWEGMINGKLTTVGYLGDLRISLDRKLIRQWRKLFGEFMKYSPQFPETNHCRYYQTVLIDENSKARNNLIETKIPGIKYEKLCAYKMINIVGHYGVRPQSKYTLDPLTQINDHENLKKEVTAFLQQGHQNLAFGHNWSKTLDYRLEHWNGEDQQDMVGLRDEKNNLVAVTSFWSPQESKKIKLSSIPKLFKWIDPLFKILPFIKTYKLPKAHSPLQIKYLNQIVFSPNLSDEDKVNIFKQLIYFALNKYRDLHFISYCEMDYETFMDKQKGLIYHSKLMGLYSVHALDESNALRDPIEQDRFAFDMVLV